MLLAIHFRKPPSVILVAIAIGCFGLSNFQFVFATIASSMLIASIPLERLRIAGVKWISDHTYAYFLLHGIFLSGMVFWMPSTAVVAIPMAILFACIAAVCLQWITKRLISRRLAPNQ
jgi:peptidoglycan/LPS O-acetylase OafA/YrhL